MKSYLYARVSTKGQQETGLSLNDQQRQGEQYAKLKTLPVPETLVDAASAFSKRFLQRPAGKWLYENMRKGDHLILAKLDRGFRDTQDCLQTIRTLQNIGVHVHILDVQVDTTSPMGEVILTVMAAIARFESRRRGERMVEAHRAARLMGRRMSKHAPIGFKWVGEGLERRTVLCEKQRAILRLILQLHVAGKSLLDIVQELRMRRLHQNGGRECTVWMVQKALKIEKELQAIEEAAADISSIEAGEKWLAAWNAEQDELTKAGKTRRRWNG